MSALEQSSIDDGWIIRFPTVFDPEPQLFPDVKKPSPRTRKRGGGAHTSSSRVRGPRNRRKSATGQVELFAKVDAPGLDLAKQFSQQFAVRRITPETAKAIALETTLEQYWKEWVKPDKTGSATNTIGNFETSVSLWARFAPRPESTEWRGMPIGLITTPYVQAWVDQALKHVGAAYVGSRWNHLRDVLNHAFDNHVIAEVPSPKIPRAPTGNATILTDDQIAAAYRALEVNTELQVAFVLAVNAGMRPVDVFCLPWSSIAPGEVSVTFQAKKTRKKRDPQTVPLAEVTRQQLRRLPGCVTRQGSVFPSLGNSKAKDPERSRPARRRRALCKSLLASVGIDLNKPFQVCRATCNVRLNKVVEGAGKLVLGHQANDVNSASYSVLAQKVEDGVMSVPQPSCFYIEACERPDLTGRKEGS